jgi:hypothetical protein
VFVAGRGRASVGAQSLRRELLHLIGETLHDRLPVERDRRAEEDERVDAGYTFLAEPGSPFYNVPDDTTEQVPTLKTDRGIGIGATYDEAATRYGPPELPPPRAWLCERISNSSIISLLGHDATIDVIHAATHHATTCGD